MIKKFFLSSVLLVLSVWAMAQAPGHVPYGKPEEVVFSPLNIILLIIVPLLMVFAYFYYRKKKREQDSDKK